MFEDHGISMAPESVRRFIEVELMIRAFEGPYGANTRAATANDSDFLPAAHACQCSKDRIIYNRKACKALNDEYGLGP